jgi:hypothetical protein
MGWSDTADRQAVSNPARAAGDVLLHLSRFNRPQFHPLMKQRPVCRCCPGQCSTAAHAVVCMAAGAQSATPRQDQSWLCGLPASTVRGSVALHWRCRVLQLRRATARSCQVEGRVHPAPSNRGGAPAAPQVPPPPRSARVSHLHPALQGARAGQRRDTTQPCWQVVWRKHPAGHTL